MVALLEPDEGMSVYDPVCGPGELLLEAVRYLQRSGRDPRTLRLYGEEKDPTLAEAADALLGQNCIKERFIRPGDPLIEPRFCAPEKTCALRQFDRVLANPPFSRPSWGYDQWKCDPFGRAGYGRPPRTYADWAYVLHMLASLKTDGCMAILMPYGALSRSRVESEIREALVLSDTLEAVVGLGLVTETSSPVAVLVFRRDRPPERRRRVLILNGAPRRDSKKSRTLSDDQVKLLVDCVKGVENVPNLCRVLTLEEVREGHFDLNPNRYFVMNSDALDGVGADVRAHRPNGGRAGADADEDEVRASTELDSARRKRDKESCELLTLGLGTTRRDKTRWGEIPSHWRLLPLREVLVGDGLRNGIKPKEGNNVEVLCVRQKDISLDGRINTEFVKRMKLRVANPRHCAVEPCDVLMRRVHASRERCGRAALLLSVPSLMVCASGVIRLRANNSRIDPLILLHWLHIPRIREHLVSGMTCSGKVSINQEHLCTLECPLIEDMAERQEIASRLRALDDAVSVAALELSSLQEARGCASMERGPQRKAKRTP